jgi:hypothetical protein
MIWLLLGIGVLLLLLPLILKTIAFTLKIALIIFGPILIIAVIVLLLLGIIF